MCSPIGHGIISDPESVVSDDVHLHALVRNAGEALGDVLRAHASPGVYEHVEPYAAAISSSGSSLNPA